MTTDELLTLRRAFTKYAECSRGENAYIELNDFPAFISLLKDVYPNHLFWEYGYNATFCEDTVTIKWRDFIPEEITDEDFYCLMRNSFAHDLANESGTEAEKLKQIINSVKNYDTVDSMLMDIKNSAYVDQFGIRCLLSDKIWDNSKYHKAFNKKYKETYRNMNDYDKLKAVFDILKNT